ncbi:hypothetical protein IFM89_014730 [Coptis chinensis]|uniref:Uncharacterized protein n=1 Tax=Coptis chinensis TaxID=261450 RepID=A0A835IQ27_9MAGN|nr:hypothetical protein IFM89_014730 [Coptis chinensis]
MVGVSAMLTIRPVVKGLDLIVSILEFGVHLSLYEKNFHCYRLTNVSICSWVKPMEWEIKWRMSISTVQEQVGDCLVHGFGEVNSVTVDKLGWITTGIRCYLGSTRGKYVKVVTCTTRSTSLECSRELIFLCSA